MPVCKDQLNPSMLETYCATITSNNVTGRVLTHCQVLYRGGISINTAGPLSKTLLGKLSRRNFQFPRTWTNIKKVTF